MAAVLKGGALTQPGSRAARVVLAWPMAAGQRTCLCPEGLALDGLAPPDWGLMGPNTPSASAPPLRSTWNGDRVWWYRLLELLSQAFICMDAGSTASRQSAQCPSHGSASALQATPSDAPCTPRWQCKTLFVLLGSELRAQSSEHLSLWTLTFMSLPWRPGGDVRRRLWYSARLLLRGLLLRWCLPWLLDECRYAESIEARVQLDEACMVMPPEVSTLWPPSCWPAYGRDCAEQWAWLCPGAVDETRLTHALPMRVSDCDTCSMSLATAMDRDEEPGLFLTGVGRWAAGVTGIAPLAASALPPHWSLAKEEEASGRMRSLPRQPVWLL